MKQQGKNGLHQLLGSNTGTANETALINMEHGIPRKR
jgi:hypothetical protein